MLNETLEDNYAAFCQKLFGHLSNNLDIILCQSVANLLALDYTNRLNSKPDLKNYINVCIERLKSHLGGCVILGHDFSEAMTLFIIAITLKEDEEDNIKSQQQSQDALIDSTIDMLFNNLTTEERANIRLVIQELLNGKDGQKILDMIGSESKLFHEIVVNTMKNKIPTQEIPNIIRTQMESIINQSKQLHKNIGSIEHSTGDAIQTLNKYNITNTKKLSIESITKTLHAAPKKIPQTQKIKARRQKAKNAVRQK